VRFFRLLSIALTLLISVQLHAAISSQVDRNAVEQGQTFLLVLNLTQNDSRQVDLSPLEKDFEIIGRSHQSSTSIINGELESSTKLIITLAPKRSGKLEVPALTLNGEKSQPHSIEVKPVKQLSAVDGGVELLSTLSDSSPMVQQPIIYQMNLVLGQRIYNASFQEPTIKQGKALIQPLGEQRQYRQTLNGREMLVVEQSWLITPQQSGSLSIEGAKLSAEIRNLNAGIDPFRRMNDPRAMRRIFLSADSYTVEVAPIPETFTGQNWLAASELQLKSELSSQQWKVGEPITRTITLKAKGIGQDQLAELVLPTVENIKQYAAKPVYEQDQKDNELSVTMTQEVTIIPSQQGEMVLPEVKLAWWNTKTNKEEVARLPQQVINVAPSAEHAQTVTVAPVEALPVTAPSAPVNRVGNSQPNAVSENGSTLAAVQPLSAWLMVAMVVVAALCGSGGTILYYKRAGLKPRKGKAKSEAQQVDLKPCLDALQRACKKNDPQLARDALLAWGQFVFPGCTHLNHLQQALPLSMSDMITELNRCCYDRAPSVWQGDQLWQAIKGYQPSSVSQGTNTLATLVPN
jgi:hypothetical protein